MTEPRYLAKLVQLASEKAADGSIKPRSMTHMQVLHDDWCDQLSGRGPCNCNPDVRYLGPTAPADAGPVREVLVIPPEALVQPVGHNCG